MTLYTHQISEPEVERIERNGREYLSFPIVPLREMIYDYPEEGTREFLPADHIHESAESWAGVPVTAVHPPETDRGQTAQTPDAYLDNKIGEGHEPRRFDDGIRVHALVDIEKARSLGGISERVVDMLLNGETLATSPGYRTVGDEYRAGMYDGEVYDLVQGVPVPDHIAVFPEDEFHARCTPEEGCAAPRVNSIDTTTMQDNPQIRESDKQRLGGVILNALGIGNGTADEDCTCGGDHDECSCERMNAGDESDDEDETPEEPAGTDDGEGDDPDEDETPDEPTKPDEPSSDDADTTDTDNSMTDFSERVERLSDETPFDADELDAMSDDQLDAIDPSAGGSDAPDTGDDGGDAQTDGPDASADVDPEEVAELKANYAELQEELEQIKDERNAAQKERDVRVVTNALGIDEETAQRMDDDVLADLAEDHRGSEQQPRTNYAGRPGEVDRQPDVPEGDVDEYPAAGRRAYEQRKRGE